MSNDIPTLDNGTTLSDITSTDTAPKGASATETVEEKAKRTYTSPRTNFANEILAYMLPLAKAWAEDEGASSTDVLSVLAKVEAEVIRLRDHGRDVVEGERRERSSTPNPYAGKHHYVARSAEGVLSYADVGKRPLPGNFPAGTVSAFGPFNTRAGAEYAVKHGIEGRNQVF